MNTTRGLIVLSLVWLGVLATSRDAATQFETPNRAFHNGTGFKLEGRHLTVPCASCHPNGQYAATPTTCYQCHWIRRRDDRYQLRLGAQCDTCHRATSWTAVTFNHAALSGVPLGANHQTMACESCHRNGQFTSAAADCVSCHARDYQAVGGG